MIAGWIIFKLTKPPLATLIDWGTLFFQTKFKKSHKCGANNKIAHITHINLYHPLFLSVFFPTFLQKADTRGYLLTFGTWLYPLYPVDFISQCFTRTFSVFLQKKIKWVFWVRLFDRWVIFPLFCFI